MLNLGSRTSPSSETFSIRSHSFSQSVFVYSRNINLKFYKNEKLVNRSKTDQIRVIFEIFEYIMFETTSGTLRQEHFFDLHIIVFVTNG